jgi:hypothetical protein
MKNNTFFGKIRRFFGTALAVGFLLGIMSAASYAQSNNLYYQSGGSYFGRVTVIPGSHFEIYTGNTVIKTYRNSCRPVSGSGLYCTFGQFRDGRIIYSGDTYIYQNGVVYLRWLYEFNGNQQRNINGGWIGFRP